MWKDFIKTAEVRDMVIPPDTGEEQTSNVSSNSTNEASNGQSDGGGNTPWYLSPWLWGPGVALATKKYVPNFKGEATAAVKFLNDQNIKDPFKAIAVIENLPITYRDRVKFTNGQFVRADGWRAYTDRLTNEAILSGDKGLTHYRPFRWVKAPERLLTNRFIDINLEDKIHTDITNILSSDKVQTRYNQLKNQALYSANPTNIPRTTIKTPTTSTINPVSRRSPVNVPLTGHRSPVRFNPPNTPAAPRGFGSKAMDFLWNLGRIAGKIKGK